MTNRRIATGLMLAAALAAGVVSAQTAAPRTVARLTALQGNVLVSQADAMAAASNEQKLLSGTRVITTAGARVTVAYANGCSVELGANRRYTVREQDACAEAKAPPLGKASSFAVIGSSKVANTGPTVVNGDLGVSPNTGVTGFPAGRVSGGSIHPGDAVAAEAHKDALKAYDQLVAQRCDTKLSGQDLGGQTLTPGVYCFPGAPAKLSGELVLDADGDSNAVWVFQVGTALTTADKSKVKVVNGGNRCNIFWQVGGSAALGSESEFAGNILATAGVEAAAKTNTVGRALVRTGAVTLDTSTIDIASCGVAGILPIAGATPAAGAAGVAPVAAGAVPVAAGVGGGVTALGVFGGAVIIGGGGYAI